MAKKKKIENSHSTDQVGMKKKMSVEKPIEIISTFLVILFIVFILMFFVAKNIIPDLLGDTLIGNEDIRPIAGELLLDKKAPYFDLSDTLGNKVRLDDFLNKPLILVFWATWNKESADQVRILDDYLLRNNTQNSLINVLAINSLEEVSIIKSFLKRGDYKVPVALDIKGNISSDYNIKSLPTTYFIDKDGIVLETYIGVLSETMIVDKVENLLK